MFGGKRLSSRTLGHGITAQYHAQSGADALPRDEVLQQLLLILRHERTERLDHIQEQLGRFQHGRRQSRYQRSPHQHRQHPEEDTQPPGGAQAIHQEGQEERGQGQVRRRHQRALQEEYEVRQGIFLK